MSVPQSILLQNVNAMDSQYAQATFQAMQADAQQQQEIRWALLSQSQQVGIAVATKHELASWEQALWFQADAQYQQSLQNLQYAQMHGLAAMQRAGVTLTVVNASPIEAHADALIARSTSPFSVQQWGRIPSVTKDLVAGQSLMRTDELACVENGAANDTFRAVFLAYYTDYVNRIVGRQWTVQSDLTGVPTAAAPTAIAAVTSPAGWRSLRAIPIGTNNLHTWICWLDYYAGGPDMQVRSCVWHQDGTITPIFDYVSGMADFKWSYIDILTDPLVANAGWVVQSGLCKSANTGAISVTRFTNLDSASPTPVFGRTGYVGVNEFYTGVGISLGNVFVGGGDNRVVLLAPKAPGGFPPSSSRVLRYVLSADLVNVPVYGEDQGVDVPPFARFVQANPSPFNQHGGTLWAGIAGYVSGGTACFLLSAA